MRDVLDDLIGWWQAGETVGMGTVVGTWRSAPRPAGASMLVGPDGTAVKARDLSGTNNLLFRRNSVSGAVEVVPWKGDGIALNAALHAND